MGLAVTVGAVVFVGEGSAVAVADGVASAFDSDVHPESTIAKIAVR